MRKLLLTILTCISLGLITQLTSCGSKEPMDLADFKNPTMQDSLLYYFVQLRAYEYWEQANKDTSMRSRKARDRFIEGFKKGYGAVSEDDADYNRGLELGMRMKINLHKFESLYDIRFDRNVMVPLMEYGLRDGAEIPEFQYQEEFYAILNHLKTQQRERDHAKAQRSLIEEAREHGMSKISDDLYYIPVKQGSGPLAGSGNTAHVVVTYEKADGEDLGIPSPGFVTIGSEAIPATLNTAYSRLNKGAVGKFATTAEAVFGSRTYVMGLKPEDVLVLTITLNEIVSPHELAHDSI